MTHARRHLETIRALLARHADTGQVPANEVRVLLAELEAALDAEPARELVDLAARTNLDRNPTEPPRP